jgi:hypothetical protein
MPSTPEALLIVIGSLLIVSSLLGGGIELAALKVPRIPSRLARVAFFLIGLLMLARGCNSTFKEPEWTGVNKPDSNTMYCLDVNGSRRCIMTTNIGQPGDPCYCIGIPGTGRQGH